MKAARKTFLAVDLGASSGRVMAGHFNGDTLSIEEVSRFANSGVQLADGWHWDVEALFAKIKKGLSEAGRLFGTDVVSVAVDSWGVDYALLDESGQAMNPPWMYRDSRTDGMMEQANRMAGSDNIWQRTGIQPMFFNTIYQLLADATGGALDRSVGILFIPDYFNYRLCGVRAIERTIASTSGLLLAGSAQWDAELATDLGISPHLLGPVREPCRILGEILPGIAAETGLSGVKVSTCGSHDTASAVAGVPSSAPPLFLSSGTWSLLGIELNEPVLEEKALLAGFSNEQGLEGRTRFLVNISGMWLLQECRRVWVAQGRTMEFAEMVEMAADAQAPGFIDPDAAEFQKPCDMPQAIRCWMEKTNQAVPATDGELIRVVLESLALKYRKMLTRLSLLVPALPDTINIVGGGCRNRLLNQMTADATGMRVEAGPVEATAAGNVIAQMIASGDIASLSEGRALLRRSFDLETYEPSFPAAWEAKAKCFDLLLKKS